jgi:CelD/BcsL family acetyltransferase involved in cellulose biosynthesis
MSRFITSESTPTAQPVGIDLLGQIRPNGRPLVQVGLDEVPAASLRKQLEHGAFRIEYCADREELSRHELAWQGLTAAIQAPNPFYASPMLGPAWDYLAGASEVGVVLIYHDGERPAEKNRLLGLFPIEWSRELGLLTVRLWRHQYCYLGEPLIRRGVEARMWRLFLNWLGGHHRQPGLVDANHIPADGAIYQGLIDASALDKRLPQCVDEYNRQMFVRGDSFESYVANSCTKHFLQEIRRQRRRLEELGRVELKQPQDAAELEVALASFLVLENAGWKGKGASSLASASQSQTYFQTICRVAYEQQRLQLLGLYLNGEPIAMKCNFLSQPGSYAFKIAFDERYARYSPGIQLELETIRLLHEQHTVEWMDSCATRGHFMISRLWGEQRTLRRLLIPLTPVGELALGASELTRRAWRCVKRVWLAGKQNR